METIDLEGAVQLFDLYCRSKGLAERTVETYRDALRGLRDFLTGAGCGQQIPTAQSLRTYMAWMLERGLSPTTAAIRMRSIRAFCNFLAREGIVEKSPMANVGIPKTPNEYPDVLSQGQVRMLLDACGRSSWTGIRNYTMLLTFIDTGVRLGELIGLNVEDVDLSMQVIRVRKGKGSKDRRVFMGRTLSRALRKWLATRTFSLSGQALFTTRQGMRLEARNVERILERTAARAGLNVMHITPHKLRHTFATHYIMNGGDPFSLQRILGHSDIKTTMIYVNLAGVGLREAHAKASPVDRLLER